MSPLAHGAICAACLTLGLGDLAWLDLRAAEMSPPPAVPQPVPDVVPSAPVVVPETAALTLTSATLETRAEAAGSNAARRALAVISFARNADGPGTEDMAALDVVIAELARDPSTIAVVEGHTDRTGPADFNAALSERRAAGVAHRLEAKGLSPDRVRVRGFGAAHPVDDGATEEALGRNRRVEVHVQVRGEP